MPPKKKSKKPLPTTNKVQQGNIKQVVNVRVGDEYTKARRAAKKTRRRVTGGGGPMASSVFSKYPSQNISLGLQTQSPMVQQPSYLNEYNMLLKQLADERKQRLQATPALAPNTTPLTMNQQRNELLSQKAPVQPFDEVTRRFAEVQTQTVNKKTYDDPQTNENMFTSPPSLGYNLSQKLPVTNFDYEDIDNYADEDEDEQNALVEDVEAKEVPKKEKEQNITNALKLNITNALIELGLTTNKKDNERKQNILRQALGDSYVEGKQPSKYTKISDLENILSYLRNSIREGGLRQGQGQERKEMVEVTPSKRR